MKKSAIILILLLPILIMGQSVEPIYITLNGDVTHPDQEISGLAWHEDDLILLPQYPDKVIYSIPKQEILEFLDSSRNVITPSEICWVTENIEKAIKGFEGFESIVFDGQQLFVTIEAEYGNQNCGYLAKGTIIEGTIALDKKSLKRIETPVSLSNMTYESILLSNEGVITIYEVNSKRVNKEPFYYEFDRDLESFSKNTFPYIDYRITYATELDDANKFWGINYFWPGDFKLLNPGIKPKNVPKDEMQPVEQLLEFELLQESIVRTNTPPLKIKLSEFGDSRNWEGLVRLDDIGFLMVTDKFPGSILAFVPYSK